MAQDSPSLAQKGEGEFDESAKQPKDSGQRRYSFPLRKEWKGSGEFFQPYEHAELEGFAAEDGWELR